MLRIVYEKRGYHGSSWLRRLPWPSEETGAASTMPSASTCAADMRTDVEEPATMLVHTHNQYHESDMRNAELTCVASPPRGTLSCVGVE